MLAVCLLASCGGDNAITEEPTTPTTPTTPQKEEPIKVSFDLSIPGVTITDEPLTKADQEDLTFIVEIDEYNETTEGSTRYLIGVFDDIAKATVDLYKSKAYNIKIAAVEHFFDDNYGLNNFSANDLNTYKQAPNASIYDWTGYMRWGKTWYNMLFDYKPIAQVIQMQLDGRFFVLKFSSNKTCDIELLFTAVQINQNVSATMKEHVISLTADQETEAYYSFGFNLSDPFPQISSKLKISEVVSQNEKNVIFFDDLSFVSRYRKTFNLDFDQASRFGFRFQYMNDDIRDQDGDTVNVQIR